MIYVENEIYSFRKIIKVYFHKNVNCKSIKILNLKTT